MPRPRLSHFACVALLLVARSAAAEDAKHGEAKEPAEKEAEPEWGIDLDVVAGATTADVLTAGRPGPVEQPPANVFDSTRIVAYSLLVGVERNLGPRFKIGARMPFVTATLTSRSGLAESRSVSVAGNLEFEAAYVLLHGKSWSLVATFEVALPTAGGNEPPSESEVRNEPTRRFDYPRYDSFAAVHAGAAVHGAYESALFEPGNLGLIPKLAAYFRFGKLSVSPLVKLENLFDLRGENEEVYINELVVGVRAGYRAIHAVEPGVRLWVRELHEHAHADDSYSTVAVVEPYVRFHVGAVQPSVSAILPFAGDLADAKTFGVRAGIAAEF